MSGLIGMISLFMLWISWEFLHKRVAKDEFRNNLFKIRQELFLMGITEKQIAHNTELYRSFETVINGTIRYAHRLSYFETKLFLSKFSKKYPKYSIKSNFEIQYEKSMKSIKEKDVREKIENLKYELNKEILFYMCKSSMIFSLFYLAIIIGLLLKSTKDLVKGTVKKASELIREIEFVAESQIQYA